MVRTCMLDYEKQAQVIFPFWPKFSTNIWSLITYPPPPTSTPFFIFINPNLIARIYTIMLCMLMFTLYEYMYLYKYVYVHSLRSALYWFMTFFFYYNVFKTKNRKQKLLNSVNLCFDTHINNKNYKKNNTTFIFIMIFIKLIARIF